MSKINSDLPVSTFDDPVDFKPAVNKRYHEACGAQWNAYDACKSRVEQGLVEPGKNCSGWYNEYWVCVDKKVSQTKNYTRIHSIITHSSYLFIFHVCYTIHDIKVCRQFNIFIDLSSMFPHMFVHIDRSIIHYYLFVIFFFLFVLECQRYIFIAQIDVYLHAFF
jgi:hypothetical protein